jgi:meso-butanediol dehydrogenase/(S,S)-butanediol dehydrogenase/diacetyl reductase
MNRFDDKRVFVTGAASGIGQATATRLASEGASLYLTDLNEGGLADTAAQCAEHGSDVEIRKLDVSNEAAVIAAIADCVSRFGGIDVVCNIAGVLLLEHFEKTTVDQFNFLVNVNLLGTFLTCRAAMPYLIESGGNIVNTSSTSALAGAGYGAVYGATKGAVSALTRGIAVEFAKKGVRCNTVVPGEVSTAMTAAPALPDDPDFTIMARQGPLNCAATPDQIASVIAMLASDDGAYINGAEIRADGGGLS